MPALRDMRARRVLRNHPLFWGIVGGGTLLCIVAHQADVGNSLRQLVVLRPESLVAPLLVSLLNFGIRGWRWHMIFPKDCRPPLKACYHVNTISIMANNFLPGRGGDLLRCVLMRREHPAGGTSMSLATLGIEKVMDGLALLAILLLSFLFWTPPVWVRRLAYLSGLVFAAALGTLFLVHRHPGRPRQLIERVVSKRWTGAGQRALGMFDRFREGLAAVRSLPHLLLLALFTAAQWFAEALTVSLLAHAMHLDLSVAKAALMSAVLGLGLMIPAAPGYLGTYEFFSVGILVILGIDSSKALALSLLLHAWMLILTTVLGLASMSRMGLTWLQVLGNRRQR